MITPQKTAKLGFASLVCGTLFLALTSAGHAAPIITNGNFSANGASYAPDSVNTYQNGSNGNPSGPAGWNLGAGNGVEQSGGAYGPGKGTTGPADPNPFEIYTTGGVDTGNKVTYAGFVVGHYGDVLSQSITLAPDTEYTLTLDVAERALTNGVSDPVITIFDGATDVVNDQALTADTTHFTADTLTFTTGSGAGVGDGSITFNDLSGNQNGASSFADIVLTEDAASVPEPSAWALMSLGLCGLVLLARHRNRMAS